MLDVLPRLPDDPILGLAAACRADPSPHKVDLTVGIYMDEDGVSLLLSHVHDFLRYVCTTWFSVL